MNYHYISKEEFDDMVSKNEFIEWCNVHDKCYGTAKKELTRIRKLKKVPILEIDVQGARKVHDQKIDSNFVFIDPPSLELLEERLRGRGTESEEQIQLRTENARKEIEGANEAGIFTTRLLNDDLDKAVEDMIAIVDDFYKDEFAAEA